MKFRSIILGLFTMFLLSSSCSDEKDTEIVGKKNDDIKLSTKTLTLDSSSSIKEVTTEGDKWVILSPIKVNEIEVNHAKPTTTDYEINGDWYTITKKGKKIIIKVSENESGKSRVIEIPLQSGNYLDALTVTQSNRK